MSKLWLPSATELRRATAARDNTNMNYADAARLLGLTTRDQMEWMRLFFAQRGNA